MRATVTRDVDPGADDWGNPEAGDFDEVGVVPCRAWSQSKRDASDDGKSVVIEDLRALVPVGADVQELDRLVIRDRLGQLQFGGPVLVEAVQPAPGPGSRARHQELMLKRHK